MSSSNHFARELIQQFKIKNGKYTNFNILTKFTFENKIKNYINLFICIPISFETGIVEMDETGSL